MSEELYQLTPLAAAIVEAMPDQQKVARVKARFRKGECPSSDLFDVAQVRRFYRERGQEITAVDHRIKARNTGAER